MDRISTFTGKSFHDIADKVDEAHRRAIAEIEECLAMPFPETRGKLKEAGYDFMTRKTCQCGAVMELWHTPKDQIIPMNPMIDDEAKAESHFATCPRAAQFRKKKPAAATEHESSPAQTQPQKPNGRAEDKNQSATKSKPPQ